MSELIKVNPEEYGIEKTKASGILKAFSAHDVSLEELKEEYNAILEAAKGEITHELVARAKAHRLKYVKVRGKIEATRKSEKDYYHRGGKFVDGAGKAYKAHSEICEEVLKEIEDHFEKIEREKIAQLAKERTAALEAIEEPVPENVGELDAGLWENFLSGATAKYNQRKEEERKEEERQAEERRKSELLRTRQNELAPLVGHVDISHNLTVDTTDQEYENMLSIARKNKDDYDEKQEEIRKENERLKKEQGERDRKENLKNTRLEIVVAYGYAGTGEEFAEMTDAKFDEMTRALKKEYDEIEAEKERIFEERKALLESCLDFVPEKFELTTGTTESSFRVALDTARKAADEHAEKSREQARLSMGDVDKATAMIDEMVSIAKRYEFQSEVYQNAYVTAYEHLDRAIEAMEAPSGK